MSLPDAYPLTPLECAHNLLVTLRWHMKPESRGRFLALTFSKREPYLDLVREMVYAELPFWELLDEPLPMIPFANNQ